MLPSSQQRMPGAHYMNAPVMPNFNMQHVPQFRKGGLRHVAQLLREQGEGEDSVLAHIHPEEAAELGLRYGYSGLNPSTGLPQYGRLFSKKITKTIGRFLPHAGALIGNALLPGIGGVIGGGLGGAISGRRDAEGNRKVFSNMMRGLGQGAMVTGGLHLGKSLLGGMTSGPGGGMTNPFSGLFGGVGSGMKAPQSIGAMQGLANVGNQWNGAQPSGGGIMDTIGGLFGSGKDLLGKLGISPLEALLGATAVGSMLKAKTKERHGPSVDEQLGKVPSWMKPGEEKPIKRTKFIRRFTPHPDPLEAGYHPEHQYFETAGDEEPEYNHGGYIDGESGGQDDKINAHVSPGEYVMDADIVSALGDGNNKAGASKLDELRVNIRRHKRKASATKIPPKAKAIEKYKPIDNYFRR